MLGDLVPPHPGIPHHWDCSLSSTPQDTICVVSTYRELFATTCVPAFPKCVAVQSYLLLALEAAGLHAQGLQGTPV